jgi:hypothetical protein
MNRLVAIPVEGVTFGREVGLRCVANPSMIKDILGANAGQVSN